MEYRLLEKTELWVRPVRLLEADLEGCARETAKVLNLRPDEVMVTDAMGDTLALDILVPTVKAEQIVARKGALLNALRGVSGIEVFGQTEVHSDGVLGLISLEEKEGQEVLQRSRDIGNEISSNIRKRCMVFSTGQEVLAGQVIDTNKPYLIERLKEEGFQATRGSSLKDSVHAIARAFRAAAEDGYGLVITTGGIGAEGKDQSLEALLTVDHEAVLPYVLKFQKGQGRHHKDGVRIGVGVYHPTLIVCLPGPHDEVQLTWPTLREGIKKGWDKQMLAEALARVLRRKFLARSGNHQVHLENMPWEDQHGTQ